MFYKKIANSVLKIDLNPNYSVICFVHWNKNISKYTITVFLYNNSAELMYLIENDEINNMQFKATEKKY